MTRDRTFLRVCLIVGAGCILLGSLVLYRATANGIPNLVTASEDQPLITIYVSEPNDEIDARADFRDSNNFILSVKPTATTPSGAVTSTVDVFVAISAKSSFSWSNLTGTAYVDPESAKSTTSKEGESKSAGFLAHFDSSHLEASIHFRSSRDVIVQSGPFIRVALPAIAAAVTPGSDNPGATGFDPARVQGQSYNEPPALSVAGQKFYSPSLSIQVFASPYDDLNGNWVLQHIAPAIASEPPLMWETSGVFEPDIVYRDSHVDQIDTIKTIIASILLGVGGGVIAMPLTLLAGASNSTTRQAEPKSGTRRISPSQKRKLEKARKSEPNDG